MPTVLGHAIVATAIGQWFHRRNAAADGDSRMPEPGRPISVPVRFWKWTAVCAMLPDADVIGFPLGIRYDDMLGHRGITHSFAFAAAVGLFAAFRYAGSAIPFPGRLRLFIYFAAITASHGLLDALTNGGRGIAFLAPFSNERFFFPWRPIQVSPIGVGFFSLRGLNVLESELLWIVAPAALVALLAHLGSRKPKRG
jgi:inner membrane protein